MPAFIYDLHQIQQQFTLDSSLLFGHSLGGQILTRFAALYPRRARALVVVEGLGPPTPPRHPDAHQDTARTLAREAQVLLKTHAAQPRLLDDLESAAARLGKNNPRLSADQAREVAQCMTQRNADGRLEWAFDPRVPSLFTTADDAARYWPHVQCPALVIAARHAGEYWRSFYADRKEWDGNFAPGELEARVASFPCGSLAELDQSGHMAHFDEPRKLAALAIEFLSNHADTRRPDTDEDRQLWNDSAAGVTSGDNGPGDQLR